MAPGFLVWISEEDLDASGLLPDVGPHAPFQIRLGAVQPPGSELILHLSSPGSDESSLDLARDLLQGASPLFLASGSLMARLRLSQVLEGIAMAMALLDESGRIQWCNPALGVLFETDPQKTIGRCFFSLIPGLPMRDSRGGIPGAERRASVSCVHADRQLRIEASPAPPGAWAILVIVRDASEEHRLQERAAEATRAATAAEARIEHLERETRLLLRFSAGEGAHPMPDRALRSTAPTAFGELVGDYGELLELRVESRVFGTQSDYQPAIRLLADRLGGLGAGPRDVVELHGESLRARRDELDGPRGSVLTDEGRLLILELMGHLVAYYRTYVPTPTNPATATPSPPSRKESP